MKSEGISEVFQTQGSKEKVNSYNEHKENQGEACDEQGKGKEGEVGVDDISIQCVSKARSIPVVNMIMKQTSDVYGKVKGYSALANWTLSTGESVVYMVVEQAAPVAKKLETPIHFVDKTVCQGITLLENKLPLVKQEPAKILVSVTECFNNALSVMDHTWHSSNDLLYTKWGAIVFNILQLSVDFADGTLDRFLPEPEIQTQDGVALVQTNSSDGPTVQTVGSVTNKAKRRIYNALINKYKCIKQQTDWYMASMSRVIEMFKAPTQNADARSKDLTGDVAEAQGVVRNVLRFCVQVPKHLNSQLLPAKLADKMSVASGYASSLHFHLVAFEKSSMKNVSLAASNLMKEQAAKIQNILEEFNDYAIHIMDEIVRMNNILSLDKDAPTESDSGSDKSKVV